MVLLSERVVGVGSVEIERRSSSSSSVGGSDRSDGGELVLDVGWDPCSSSEKRRIHSLSSSSGELSSDGGWVLREHPLSGLDPMSLLILNAGESLLLLLLLELSVKDGCRGEVGILGWDGRREGKTGWSADALSFLRKR